MMIASTAARRGATEIARIRCAPANRAIMTLGFRFVKSALKGAKAAPSVHLAPFASRI